MYVFYIYLIYLCISVSPETVWKEKEVAVSGSEAQPVLRGASVTPGEHSTAFSPRKEAKEG